MNYPSTHKSLLERVQNGEEVAWREFYDRYAPVIRFVGSLYQFNEFECEDLVQNVMLKFFDCRKKFVYRKSKCCRNKLCDTASGRNRQFGF